MRKGKSADLDSPTWKNLIKVFGEAEIDLNKCFFSNVFMGLRDTDKITGEFLGFKDMDFVKMNLEFFLFQIETIKPKAIISLGKYAAEMLTYVAKDGLDSWKGWKVLSTPNIGLKFNVRFKNHSCKCIALECTSMRNSNVKRRVYGNYCGHSADV